MQFVPRARILTLEEILFIARAFCDLGVTKIRVTGGEPLVRRNILWLLNELGRLDGLQELVLTTNGSQLEKLGPALREAGVKRINISLDSLRPNRFHRMTRVGDLDKVLRGIDATIASGFERIKLNAVILKNVNDDEILDLTRFAINKNLDISFIEEMPLGIVQEHERAAAYYSSDDVLKDLASCFELEAINHNTGGPSRYYQINGGQTRVGFISPHSHNFCADCNRVRLTAEGRLLLCLGQENSVDLRSIVRAHPGDREKIMRAILDSMSIKPKGHEFDLGSQKVILRHMNATGG